MEQQQFRVAFPLRTKLLFGVVALFVIVIGFLTISTTVLLKEDKRAYTYLVQDTQAQLAAKDFLNRSNLGIDILRQSLAAIDPTREITPQQQENLRSIVNNQGSLEAMHIERISIDRKRFPLVKIARNDAPEGSKTFEVTDEWIETVLPELFKEGFAFVNLSKTGSTAMLGLLLADNKYKDHPAGLPVAMGLIPLESLGKEIRGSNLTIASKQGWVLFDSDPTNLYTRKNLGGDPFFRSAVSGPTTTGAQEFTRDGTALLGSYVRPGLDVVVLIQTEWRKAMGAFYALIEKFFLFGGIAIGIAVIATILFAKRLTAPLSRLYGATAEVAKGNFNIEVEAKGRDEIGALSSSFTVMSQKIQELIQESMEKVRMEAELSIASTVQQTLIPPPKIQDKNILIRSHYQSASECGGDWWGYVRTEDHFALLIADATGHGLPSALITAAARSCFSVIQKLAQEDPSFAESPAKMLSYANRVVYEAAQGSINMTFFAGVIDFKKRVLTYASAGHNPPWLFQPKAGSESTFDLKSLTAKGQRLGESPDSAPFEEKQVSLTPNDILFLYTDGIIEGKNPEGAQYGKKQMRKVIEASLKSGPEALIQALVADFGAHNGDKPLDDDVTLTAAQILL